MGSPSGRLQQLMILTATTHGTAPRSVNHFYCKMTATRGKETKPEISGPFRTGCFFQTRKWGTLACEVFICTTCTVAFATYYPVSSGSRCCSYQGDGEYPLAMSPNPKFFFILSVNCPKRLRASLNIDNTNSVNYTNLGVSPF